MDTTTVQYRNTNELTVLQRLQSMPNSRINRRRIVTFREDAALPSNEIHTSKYTAWNFIPKNLFEQFSKPSNVYFLVCTHLTQIIGIFQVVPYTSLTNGIPTIYMPLGIIILLSAIKDFYEDVKRSESDKSENAAMYQQMKSTAPEPLVEIRSADIRPGMVIRVNKDQQIPVDGLIVGASQSSVYVSTKNLDGETNLKRKNVLKHFQVENQEVVDDRESNPIPVFLIEYEPPNDLMERFDGLLTFDSRNPFQEQRPISININYVCLRGSALQKSDFVYLLVLYTGHDTKILMSMNNPPAKKSTIERKLLKLIIFIFCVIIGLAILMAVLKLKTRSRNSYFFSKFGEPGDSILSMFGWMLNLTNLVPISLIVTLETVKLLQGKMIMMDPKMKNQDFESKVNCSSMVEDLGTVEFVASDKTGTLTKNQLTLREIHHGSSVYFNNEHAVNPPSELLQMLCLCHEAYVSQHSVVANQPRTYQYEAQSQDEICILDYCKAHTCTMTNRTEEMIELRIEREAERRYEILAVLEFTSERKRQSVIYKRIPSAEEELLYSEEASPIYIVVKGADSEVKKLLRDQSHSRSQEVVHGLEECSKKGYRTLLVAGKELPAHFAEQWIVRYRNLKVQQASSAELQERKLTAISELVAEVQKDLEAICAIGIQDELQDEVPAVIRTILEAGIKFVIISGDKRQTVKAIAENLRTNEKVVLADEDNIYHEKYESEMLVVFGRCTPRQKQMIVSRMKGRVLAIGDGANDVSMLTKASVGVGIAGKEGKAAVQAADFGIPEFRFLRRLMFYYGRELYRKNAQLVKYNFYKNFLYTFPQVTFAFFSGYTGVSIYETYLSQLYNLIFTSLPIMIYSICDEAEDQHALQQNERNLYAVSKKQVYFSNLRIFLYLLQAIVLGIITSYLCFLLAPILYRSPNDLNLYEISSILMLYVVVYANMRVLFMEKRLNFMIFISVIVGILGFFICFRIILFFSSVIESSYTIIFKIKTGLIILLCVIASLIATLLFEIILGRIYQHQESKVQRIQHHQTDPNHVPPPNQ